MQITVITVWFFRLMIIYLHRKTVFEQKANGKQYFAINRFEVKFFKDIIESIVYIPPPGGGARPKPAPYRKDFLKWLKRVTLSWFNPSKEYRKLDGSLFNNYYVCLLTDVAYYFRTVLVQLQ